jgi:hypothetical protein
MAIEVEITCPLGSECETVVGKVIKRCAWYCKLVGNDPSTGKDVDEWGCSMSFMPMLMVEMSGTNRGQTEALESMRNETVKGQEEFNKLIVNTNRLPGDKQ